MVWIWIGLIITLTLIELLTTNLITIWYVGSAFVALILSFFIDSYLIQFFVFAILGTILLFVVRDKVLKILNEKKKDKIINKVGVVIEEIKKNKAGKIKLNNRKYIAIANKKININHKVKVIEIDGVKLKVVEDNNEK